MITSEGQGPVICAWCAAELRRSNLKTPLSHGICLSCMAAVTGDPVEDLSQVPKELLDEMPFGVIELSGDGRITGYNRGESALSGLRPEAVIGKNFFREVAPCTAVRDFQGVLQALRAKRQNAREKLRFVFKFAQGAKQVEVAMAYRAATDTATLLVRVVLSEPKL